MVDQMIQKSGKMHEETNLLTPNMVHKNVHKKKKNVVVFLEDFFHFLNQVNWVLIIRHLTSKQNWKISIKFSNVPKSELFN